MQNSVASTQSLAKIFRSWWEECDYIQFISLLNKTSENCFNTVNLYFPCTFWLSVRCKIKKEPRDIRRAVSGKITTSSEKGLVSTSRTYVSPKGTGPGVRRSKRPLSACHNRRKCSMETYQNSVKGQVRYKVWSVGGCHCIWSGHRMSLNICERETSYCLIRSPYRP